MMTKLKEVIANFKLRRIEKRVDAPMVSFPEVLMKPRHVLVCLPGGLRELTIVKQFLNNLTDLFKPADITLLANPGIKVVDIFPRKGFQILSPSADQVTWSGLPQKAFLQTLHDYKFDLLLDLNFELNVFISGILLDFPLALRIGRGNHLGKPYYNMEIKTKYLRDERNIYRSLLDTIGEIKNNIRNVPPPKGK